MEPRVHAVVLNYNCADASLRARAELLQSTGCSVQVLVVDCASDAEDRKTLEQAVPAEELLLLDENRGYAGGMNAGINAWLERAPDVPVLLLTPDAHLPPDGAAKLLNTMNAEPRAGVVGPVVIYSESPRKIAAGGTVDARGRVQPLRELRADTPHDVDWLDGCCLLLRPEALRQVNGFDEDYFLYYEETDLCLRLRQHGWRVLLVPSVSVLHPKTASSAPPHYYYYMARNGYRFRARHFGVPAWRNGLELLKPAVQLTAIAAACTVLPSRWRELRDRWRNCRLVWRGIALGTRDHLRGSYGPQTGSRTRPA